MATDDLEFWFDFSSPYAYFGALEIDRIAERHGVVATWRPFLLGAVFEVTGSRPLVDVPIRRDYVKRDWSRLARRRSVPFTFPAAYPKLTVTPARAFYVLEDRDPALARRFARAVFDVSFGAGRDASTVSETAAILADIGVEAAPVLEAIATSEVKDRFRRRNEEAIARGVFGAPFFIVKGEPFWGADRLAEVEAWLATGGW